MNNKVLIKLSVPEIGYSFDVFIPVNEIVWKIKKMLAKSISDLTGGVLNPNANYLLLNKETSEVYGVLGLFKQDPNEFIKNLRNKYLNKLNITEEYITSKIKERKEAKQNKNYELADAIRKELTEKGIILNDTNSETNWDIEMLY